MQGRLCWGCGAAGAAAGVAFDSDFGEGSNAGVRPGLMYWSKVLLFFATGVEALASLGSGLAAAGAGTSSVEAVGPNAVGKPLVSGKPLAPSAVSAVGFDAGKFVVSIEPLAPSPVSAGGFTSESSGRSLAQI